MKGLSAVERIVIECIGKKGLRYEDIQVQSGLQGNICFNIIQALIIKGIIRCENFLYRINESIPHDVIDAVNGKEGKRAESLEFIEATLELESNRIFKYQKIALEDKDEKIFIAMLSNLESFLKEAHLKAQNSIPVKDRKVVFWGMGDHQAIVSQIMGGY